MPLFAWNTILKFHFQIPIGDPLMYSDEFEQLTSTDRSKNFEHKKVLIMPKKNDELDQADRLSDYARLIEFAKEFAPSQSLTLSLHPAERHLQEWLCNSYGLLNGWASIDKDRGSEAPTTQLTRLAGAAVIVSDYIGAHAIRANAYFGAEIVLPENFRLPKAVDANLRPYLHDLVEPSINSIDRTSVSQLLVGARHKRSGEELKHILFKLELPKTTRKVYVALYKKGRRAKVWLRQSSWFGKSTFARIVRHRVLQKLWEARFN